MTGGKAGHYEEPRATKESRTCTAASRHRGRAGITALAGGALTVVGGRQEREVFGDAVRRDVRADHPRRSGEEIDAVANMSVDVIGAADHAHHDVGDVVVGATSIGIARRVAA